MKDLNQSRLGQCRLHRQERTKHPFTINVCGRDRWALECLIAAGDAGCTPIDDLLQREPGCAAMVPCDEDQNQRQAHLSLRWETRHLWHRVSSAIGSLKKPEHIAAVAIALYAEAIGRGRGVCYSRSKVHYDLPERYRSRLYTYRSVVGSIDRLENLDLIHNYRASPGQRGWQSWCQPKPELVDIVGGIVGHDLKLASLREPVLLRNDKQLIDYQDTPDVRRMRQELHEQNEAIVGANLNNVISLRGRLRSNL